MTRSRLPSPKPDNASKENHQLFVAAPGINGQNGFRILGRRATGLRTAEQFSAFLQGIAFPNDLLHPAILIYSPGRDDRTMRRP